MQLWTAYNPDDVSDDKIILADDWTGKTLTYGGARTSAARGAQGLQEVFNLGIGDVVAVCASNSVCVRRDPVSGLQKLNSLGRSCQGDARSLLGWWNSLVCITLLHCCLAVFHSPTDVSNDSVLFSSSAFNPLSSVDDFAHYLVISQAKILVIDFAILEVASAAIKQLGSNLKYPVEIMLLGKRGEKYKSVGISSQTAHASYYD